MNSLVAAPATENKPKLFRRVRDEFVCTPIRSAPSRQTEIGSQKSEVTSQSIEDRALLFDVDLAVEKEQDKGDSEQWSQQRLDNPEEEAGQVKRLRL